MEGNTVYVLTLYSGEDANNVSEDLNNDNYIGYKKRMFMSIRQTKEDAIELKERCQKYADENGFGDYDRYFVESWHVYE